MQDLNSPTRDQTYAPCSGSMKSLPLDHQESQTYILFKPRVYIMKNFLQAAQSIQEKKRER